MLPDLHHYYDESTGPFCNLSDLEQGEAERILADFRLRNRGFAAKRPPDYMTVRRELERQARELFMHQGGTPVRMHPHYMTLGPCPWLLEWYGDGRQLSIPVAAFDPATISFTYGDLFPTMRYRDGKPYRGKVYTLEGIEALVREFGFPQEWNPAGNFGPERYIEAQVWDDAPLRPFVAGRNPPRY
ncbi:MAG: hypothetical protein J7639_02925 [Paenibacillaceae bacterium]|nr:hypothetical protein [Paenibacillaceae bacterium]